MQSPLLLLTLWKGQCESTSREGPPQSSAPTCSQTGPPKCWKMPATAAVPALFRLSGLEPWTAQLVHAHGHVLTHPGLSVLTHRPQQAQGPCMLVCPSCQAYRTPPTEQNPPATGPAPTAQQLQSPQKGPDERDWPKVTEGGGLPLPLQESLTPPRCTF